MNSKCNVCFKTGNFQKYCAFYQDASSGKCCLSSTGEDCLKDYYYCSDKSLTTLSYHKYAYCSYNQALCGSPTRTIKSRETPTSVFTSLEFMIDDVCPYIIVADSDLMFNTKIQISLNKVYNTDVYLIRGRSQDDAF
jgi:hypothetical protein